MRLDGPHQWHHIKNYKRRSPRLYSGLYSRGALVGDTHYPHKVAVGLLDSSIAMMSRVQCLGSCKIDRQYIRTHIDSKCTHTRSDVQTKYSGLLLSKPNHDI